MDNYQKKSQNFSVKLRRLKALVIKEFYQIIRDSSSIMIAFIFPIILLGIYGFGVSLDMDNLKIGVVLEDNNSKAQSFFLSLRNSKYFSVQVDRNIKKLQKKLEAGEIRGIVTVPFYFSEYLNRPDRKAPIYVVADGSEPNTANFVQNYLQATWSNWILQEAISSGKQDGPIIDIQPRVWFNEALNSRFFLIPGAIALIMTLIGSLLTALVVAREWERGTIEALMATPITMKEIYIAKTFTYFCLGMLSMIVCTVISIIVFQLPFLGSIIPLLIVSATFLLTALGTGLLVSILTKNQFLASQISIVTAFLPAFMLSGFIFEISSMPFLIRILTYIIPARYMITCLESLFLVGNVHRLLIINVSIMALVVVALFLIIFTKTKKRLD
ncbi:MAG: ABC transporter permease [Parachlamydiales bacterium]|nr:ABC transporter permease [Parachlamydiales bacterium]